MIFSEQTVYDIMLLGFLMLGIVGTILPLIPGPSLIVVGAFVHGLITNFIPLSLLDIALLAFLASLAWIGQYILAGLGAKSFGGSKAGMVGAIIGLVLGLILPIPGSTLFGMILGTFVGAIAGELFVDNDEGRAVKAGIGAVIGICISFVFEISITTIMVIFVVVNIIS